jgi:hypothetical protein
MTQITHLLIARIADELTAHLQTPYSIGDENRVNEVVVGRFQEDPTMVKNYISITGGMIEKSDFVDGLVSLSDMAQTGWNFPVAEIGGGVSWLRRGQVNLGVFMALMKKKTQITASELAHNIFGRTQHYLERVTVCDLVDTFREKALYLQVYSSNFFESGGPPDSYIWRGALNWQVVTTRPGNAFTI